MPSFVQECDRDSGLSGLLTHVVKFLNPKHSQSIASLSYETCRVCSTSLVSHRSRVICQILFLTCLLEVHSCATDQCVDHTSRRLTHCLFFFIVFLNQLISLYHSSLN